MTCYSPITAWQSAKPSPTGKSAILFSPAYGSKRIQLPCGQCIGCRLDRTRDWAIRCMHESQMHDDNCFLTLTYDNEHLPADAGLRKSDVQKFLKRLRKFLHPRTVRYYFAGEYGELNKRPHYHAVLFGYDFPDKILVRDGDNKLYSSEILNKIWGMGACMIGAVTMQSAAYVAAYCTKKVNGKKADEERIYERYNSETGEIHQVLPEFALMSLKPAIGAEWYRQFGAEVYPRDTVVVDGREVRPPRYYDKLLDSEDSELLAHLKDLRVKRAYVFDSDNTPRRNRVKAKCKEAAFKVRDI